MAVLLGRLLERDDIVDHAEDVAFLHDEQVLAVDLDLGPRPFAEKDPVAGFHGEFDEIAVVIARAETDGDDFAFLRHFLAVSGLTMPAEVFSSASDRKSTRQNSRT